MSPELLILRHAKSDQNAAVEDFQRPLNARGRHEAGRIGHWLAAQQLLPDVVISSPAQRARETTLKACKAMHTPKQRIVFDERLYLADRQTLLAVLQEVMLEVAREVMPAQADTAPRVLLVGHNPGLEDLLRFLTGDQVPMPDDGKLLPTASVARLELPAGPSLSAVPARLISITRAKTLPPA